MIPYKKNIIILQFETQKEFANKMMDFILNEDMERILFNDEKEIFLKKANRYINSIKEEHKDEIKKEYKDWIIVLSTGERYCGIRNNDPEYIQERVKESFKEALTRWDAHTGPYPEYAKDYYYLNRQRILDQKRKRNNENKENKEFVKKYREQGGTL